MNKKVLLTGATGFIGRQCIEPLERRGFEVHAVYREEPLADPRATWHKADLLSDTAAADLCAVVRPTHLLHMAWYVNPKDYKTSPENEKWVDATTRLMNAFVRGDGSRAVLAGTCMEYDWSATQEYLSEASSSIDPQLPYGKAKDKARRLCTDIAIKNGVSLAWGRIFLLYGPHEASSRLVPYVINSLLREEKAQCSSGEQIRDIMYVQDVADAFCATLDSSVEGPINIGSGIPVSLGDVVRTIASLLEKPDLLELGARTDEGPARLVFDTQRLNKEVGWHPHYSLEEGLRETIEWWRSNRA